MEKSTGKSGKLQLSKAVMSMKFMKKKEEIEEKEKQEKQLIQQLQHGDWTEKTVAISKDNVPKVMRVSTLDDGRQVHWLRETKDVYSVLPGRRSFNGCNRAIEQFYQSLVDEKVLDAYSKNQKIKKEDATSSMEEEPVEEEINYDQLVSLPRGPNQGKRSIPNREDRTGKKQKLSDTRPSQSSFTTSTASAKKMQYELIRKKDIRKKIDQKKKQGNSLWSS